MAHRDGLDGQRPGDRAGPDPHRAARPPPSAPSTTSCPSAAAMSRIARVFGAREREVGIAGDRERGVEPGGGAERTFQRAVAAPQHQRPRVVGANDGHQLQPAGGHWRRGRLVGRQDRPGTVGEAGDVVDPRPAGTRRAHQHPQVCTSRRGSGGSAVSISTFSTRGMYSVPSPPMASSSSELTMSSGTGGFATTNGPAPSRTRTRRSCEGFPPSRMAAVVLLRLVSSR